MFSAPRSTKAKKKNSKLLDRGWIQKTKNVFPAKIIDVVAMLFSFQRVMTLQGVSSSTSTCWLPLSEQEKKKKSSGENRAELHASWGEKIVLLFFLSLLLLFCLGSQSHSVASRPRSPASDSVLLDEPAASVCARM